MWLTCIGTFDALHRKYNTFYISSTYYATLRPHFGIGGGVGVDLEEETFSLLIFWFDDVASFLFDVWLLEESGWFCEVPPPFALASAAFNFTHVSPSALAKWSSTRIWKQFVLQNNFNETSNVFPVYKIINL